MKAVYYKSASWPPTGCSRSFARRPGLWRQPASCSCFGAGCPDALRTARCAGAQGRRVGGGCVGEGLKGRIPGALRPHPWRRARSLFLDKGLVATAQNPRGRCTSQPKGPHAHSCEPAHAPNQTKPGVLSSGLTLPLRKGQEIALSEPLSHSRPHSRCWPRCCPH